jgi:Sulfotransferase domain
MPSPRFIKTHLPVALLPDQLWTVKPRIVYIRRNPKDTVVSWYHHHRLLHGYHGNLDDFVEAFLDDLIMYSPYHEHILEFCKLAETESNILSIRYEDMKMDIGEVIKKTAEFFDVKLNFVQIDILSDHLSLKSMRGK